MQVKKFFFSRKGALVMKKILLALLVVFVLSSAACAAVPSVTMLSTKTCPACAQMSKVLDKLDDNYRGRITTARIYLESNPDIAKKYNIRYVPTLIFRDASGKEIAQEVGYRSENEILKIFAGKGIKF